MSLMKDVRAQLADMGVNVAMLTELSDNQLADLLNGLKKLRLDA